MSSTDVILKKFAIKSIRKNAKIALFLSGCATNLSKNLPKIDLTQPKPANPQALIKAEMAHLLKDPMSAVYKFTKLSRTECQIAEFGTKGRGRFVVWSMPFLINAKNLYGAYIGNSEYIARFSSGKVVQLLPLNWISSTCGLTYVQAGIPTGDPRRITKAKLNAALAAGK